MPRAPRLAGLLLAAPLAAAAAGGADEAAALRAELRAKTAALEAQRGDFVRRLQEVAGPLVRSADGELTSAAYAQSERLTAEHRAATAPLLLELTAGALRLQAFKETGVLPDEAPDAEELLAAIMAPWQPSRPEVELPAGDLRALERQLERWSPKPARRPEPLVAAAPASPAARPLVAGLPARFARDAGTGRVRTDPVPGLLADLSAPEPRRRALAADELGGLGPAAAAAAGPLRAALSDPDARVRASAARALGVLGVRDPELRRSLEGLLLDASAEVRLSTKAALARLDAAP
ncbi:MAG: HEAT repeat domain-containing protein [Elusimicrobiota bacterium]|nr:HEAT repeat domain-containing protein [Elusimicrobiota bacterium]